MLWFSVSHRFTRELLDTYLSNLCCVSHVSCGGTLVSLSLLDTMVQHPHCSLTSPLTSPLTTHVLLAISAAGLKLSPLLNHQQHVAPSERLCSTASTPATNIDSSFRYNHEHNRHTTCNPFIQFDSLKRRQ